MKTYDLKYAISDLIVAKERELVCTLPTKDFVKLTEMIHNFNIALVEKFIKGQKEHGGSLSDRDLIKEARAEVMDMVVYTHWQKDA